MEPVSISIAIGGTAVGGVTLITTAILTGIKVVSLVDKKLSLGDKIKKGAKKVKKKLKGKTPEERESEIRAAVVQYLENQSIRRHRSAPPRVVLDAPTEGAVSSSEESGSNNLYPPLSSQQQPSGRLGARLPKKTAPTAPSKAWATAPTE